MIFLPESLQVIPSEILVRIHPDFFLSLGEPEQPSQSFAGFAPEIRIRNDYFIHFSKDLLL